MWFVLHFTAEFRFKFFDRMVQKRKHFLKIINLYWLTLWEKNTYFATIVFNVPVTTIDTARVNRYAVHLIFVGKFWPPHYDLSGFPMILISEINSSPKLYCKFSFSDFANRAPVVFKQQSYLRLNFEKLLLFWSKTPKWYECFWQKGILKVCNFYPL